MKMVNNQTGPEGVIAHKVLIARPIDYQKRILPRRHHRPRKGDADSHRFAGRGHGDRRGR